MPSFDRAFRQPGVGFGVGVGGGRTDLRHAAKNLPVDLEGRRKKAGGVELFGRVLRQGRRVVVVVDDFEGPKKVGEKGVGEFERRRSLLQQRRPEVRDDRVGDVDPRRLRRR